MSDACLIRAAGPLPTVVSLAGETWTPIRLEDRIQAYERALNALEADMQRVADGVRSNPDGVFGWALTPDWHRRDDLKGLVHWYYLIELVTDIHHRAPMERLAVNDLIPSFVQARLQHRLCVPLRVPLKVKLKKRVEWTGGVISSIARLARTIGGVGVARRRNSAILADRDPVDASELLVQMPPPHMRHRYGPLLADLSQRYRVLPFGLDIRLKHRHSETRYDPSAHYHCSDLIAVARRTRALRSDLKRIHTPEQMPEALVRPAVTELMLSMIDYLAIDRMLLQCSADAVVLFWPCARPKTRMVIEACRRRGVPVVLVPGRTLSRMKAAERLIPADRKTCRLDDPNLRLIVPDRYSLETCRWGGFRDNQLWIGSTHVSAPSVSDPFADADDIPVLLVLLQADRVENRDLLTSLCSGLPDVGSYRVRVRSHPKLPLSDAEKLLVAAMDPDWQDVTGQDYQNCIAFRKTVAVTVFSTSGVDVAAHGAGLIWLPWITDQAITMCDIMDVVGEKSTNLDELAHLLEELKDGTRLAAFCDDCKDQADAFDAAVDICQTFSELEREFE